MIVSVNPDAFANKGCIEIQISQKKTEETANFTSVSSVAFCSILIQRVTHRGNELFVIERLHEKCDRANGHGRGARR